MGKKWSVTCDLHFVPAGHSEYDTQMFANVETQIYVWGRGGWSLMKCFFFCNLSSKNLFINIESNFPINFKRVSLTQSSSKKRLVICQSNQNSPPGETPGIWLSSVPKEWGIRLLHVWGEENWTRSVRIFFFRVPKSLTAIKHVFVRDGRVWRKRGHKCLARF